MKLRTVKPTQADINVHQATHPEEGVHTPYQAQYRRATTPTTAEQFLAKQGIKFRAVPSERGPGEWNVTLSRKGGGRLKLDFAQQGEPTAQQVLREIQVTRPVTLPDSPEGYEDWMEYTRAERFFKVFEIVQILRIQDGQG